VCGWGSATATIMRTPFGGIRPPPNLSDDIGLRQDLGESSVRQRSRTAVARFRLANSTMFSPLAGLPDNGSEVGPLACRFS
jgi:hypothetical protein